MSDVPLHADRVRASSFGEDAELYDRARPTYPTALVDYLCERHPREVLDIGCGTGIASRLLQERGCEVVGVEPDARMAEIAQRSGVAVEVGTFEDWNPDGRNFELVTSAQAWHWVDSAIGTARIAEVLVQDGVVGLFWNVGRPERRVRDAFDRCYQQFAAGVEEYSVLLGHGESGRFASSANALTLDSRFAEIERRSFDHSVEYTTAQWIEQLDTHSDHRNLDPPRKAPLFEAIGSVIDSFGGAFELRYETVCVRARRI